MIGKIALLAVALMLLSATVAVAGPARNVELDNNPTPSDIVLSEATVPLYNSSDVWPGTIDDQNGRDNPGNF